MTELEELFARLWSISGRGDLVTEHRFDLKRDWRFDFANVDLKIAVEVEGGVFRPNRKRCPVCKQTPAGRHSRPMGFHDDCDKYNAAALDGWAVFRFTSKHLDAQPIQCVELVNKAIESRGKR
jgi:very-short-patch-repair endonuclease